MVSKSCWASDDLRFADGLASWHLRSRDDHVNAVAVACLLNVLAA